jgi:Type I restriction enzyme R protein N terminus (HSDR_N)
MSDAIEPYNVVIDFITGKKVPEIGAEANRQKFERFLVEKKGFAKEDIEVDVDIEIEISGALYRSQIDLVVSVAGKRFMAVKCCAASLGSREREIVSASRIMETYQIPLSIVSDGDKAIVLETISGKKLGQGLEAVPAKTELERKMAETAFEALPENRREKEKLIFRTYDSANINVRRNL